jgi:hypothetical protein
VPNGLEYHLGIKFGDTTVRMVGLPKIHELEDLAPTMNFRYIESPDGVFHYPLFTTEEEAEYYDEIHNGLTAGTGSSHTHTYADDPTNTTWYMPEASHDPTNYTFSVAPSTTTFSGNPVTYTEITSLTNADLTPPQFSGSDITQEEGTNVNIQVTPAGASWTTSVSISPSSSGLVYDNYSVIQGTLTDVGSDTTYTISVTRANAYGSTTGTMTVTATDVAPVQTNDTAWTKALDFSGSNEHLKQVHNHIAYQPMQMNGYAQQIATPQTAGNTAHSVSARPWATTVVFKSDGHSSQQIIWNQGEGYSNGDDNISLKLSSTGSLLFQWGRQGTGINECKILNNSVSSSHWYGVCIAHTGERLSGNNASASRLAACFDIRVMSSVDSFASLSSNLSTSSNWHYTGQRMDRTVDGDLTIGGINSTYQTYRGKIASMVVTTLKIDDAMPTASEIELMISDPVKWANDYKVGNSFRRPIASGNTANFLYNNGGSYAYIATQIWLMGDGTSDSYANGVRNQVLDYDQNYTRLQLNSMVSNDIETVNINGLT